MSGSADRGVIRKEDILNAHRGVGTDKDGSSRSEPASASVPSFGERMFNREVFDLNGARMDEEGTIGGIAVKTVPVSLNTQLIARTFHNRHDLLTHSDVSLKDNPIVLVWRRTDADEGVVKIRAGRDVVIGGIDVVRESYQQS
ncbi:hypothetical protein K2Y11_17550 [bacterium]|nr:hypothetical protein [bacterium]